MLKIKKYLCLSLCQVKLQNDDYINSVKYLQNTSSEGKKSSKRKQSCIQSTREGWKATFNGVFLFMPCWLASYANILVTLWPLPPHWLIPQVVENYNQHFPANVQLATNSFKQIQSQGFHFFENKFKFNSLLKFENSGFRPRILFPVRISPIRCQGNTPDGL